MKTYKTWCAIALTFCFSIALMLEYKINVANAAPTISVSGLSFSASGTGTCSYTGGTYLDAGFTQNWNTVNSPVTVDCNWSGSFSSWNFTAGQTYYVKIVFTDSSGSVTGTSSYTQPAAATTTTTTAATTTTTTAATTTTTTAATTTTTTAATTTTTTTAMSTTTVRATTTTAPSSSTKAWSNAPEPSGTGNVMWAEIYQTPEGSDYGKITSYACGSKTQYGINGSTGGQNLGGGDRLGTRYIYFADTCGVSQAPSNSAFNTSTYVFTLANGYTRYAGVLIAPSSNTTTTTTSTTSTTSTSTTTTTTTSTTVPKTVTTKAPTVTIPKSGGTASTVPSSRPEPPVAPQVSLLGASAVRVNWGDSSSNETGFIIQRSDRPVGAGVSTAMWPYKTSANSTSFEFSGLAVGSQVCFAVASFNSTGASKFSEWACMNLANPGAEVTPPPDATLTCDAVVAKNVKQAVSFAVTAGVSNGGRLLKFEYYEKGKWFVLGQARVDGTGKSTLTLKSVSISKPGVYPIRATQGSRFICEGDLNVAQTLKAFKRQK